MGNFKVRKYGVSFTDEITLKNKYITIKDIKLLKVKRKFNKEYYNNPFSNNDSIWTTEDKRTLLISLKDSNKYIVSIPPLEPNKLYKVKYNYYTAENILSIFRMIHEEGNNNWFNEKKDWMKKLDELNAKYDKKYDNASLTYQTNVEELIAFKNLISKYNFNKLNELQKKDIISITKNHFKILNFESISQNDQNKLDVKIIEFANEISKKQFRSNDDNSNDDLILFETIFPERVDYVNVYNFYEKYLKNYLDSKNFSPIEYCKHVENSLKEEKKYYKSKDIVPNFISIVDRELNEDNIQYSTFPENFDSSYKNALVPDFGFVLFSNTSNTLKGGSPFLGVNISLKPSNKNIPLQISNLDILQRLSIHTGILLNSINENKVREDLFKKNSLLLGAGYKVFNHAYRINCGGIIYKQIDPINGSKKFAVAPYVGISIDIEIKKWLTNTIPGLIN